MIRVQNRCLQRSLVAYLIAIFLGGMAVSQAVGQELVVKEQKFEGLEILELGAIVTPSADGPRVADVVPDAGRLEEYRGVNLQSGDLIVSVNGQLTKKLSDLQAILDPLVPGDTIRLALQRLGSFAVASYVVAAPEEAEKARQAAAAFRKSNPTEGPVPGGGPHMVKLIGGEGSQPWIDLAVLLEDTDDGIKVAQKIEMPQFAKGVTLEEGDLINSIQGESVLKIEKLMAAYDKIAAGKEVTINVTREEREQTFVFTKPDAPKGNVRMMKR